MTEAVELELKEQIREFLGQDNWEQALTLLSSRHPADIGSVIDELEPDYAYELFDHLELARQAKVLAYLSTSHQLSMVRRLNQHALARLFTEMNADERADLYQELPEDVQEILMPALAKAEREDLLRLAGYEEGTVGAIMTSEYATLPGHINARRAVERLRAQALNKETIYIAYVLDSERRLLGTITLAGLVIAPDDQKVGELIHRDTVSVNVHDPQSQAAKLIADYDLLAIPVVDDHEAMVGIVTHDDAMDVQEAEATEDFHKGATVGAMPSGFRQASLRTLYQKRIFWLILLVFANVFSGASIALYEDTLAAHIGLVFFLPLLIASSGNAGTQSATLMVRAMATGEVVTRDWGRMLIREISVGLALGLTMAFAVAGIGLVRSGPEMATVAALTMVIVVLAGSLIGMSLPFLLDRLNLDPATASGPVVTFIADVAGILIYFAIATAILTLPT